jgi:hypothetical protein
MSRADDEIQCPHCEKTLRRRDLHAVTVQTCRWCGGFIEGADQWAQRDEEGMLREDVDTIAAWLDSVAQAAGLQVQPVRDREPIGEFLWSIRGLPFSWLCEAVYERSRPGVVRLRLRTEVSAPEVQAESKTLETACAARGVQASAMKGAHIWWGAAQALFTAWLPPSLFRPIVDRLDEVLRDVASRFPPG